MSKMADKNLDEERTALLASMRTAFHNGDYEAVLASFESLGDMRSLRSGIRVEAICLAARVKSTQGGKQGARLLLKQVWSAPLKNHRLCRIAAIACLELGEYQYALALTERALSLSQAAKEATAE
jgi:tetratricopeptide (TPR) repeat protein